MKYHRKGAFISIIIFWNLLTNAQVITGVICDKVTKLPIPNVYVVLDEIYAITDVSGRFELKTNLATRAKMALHHVSYQDIVIDNPFDLSDTLYIEEQTNILSELVVTANNRRVRIIRRVVVLEVILEGVDSISHLKIIRSSRYPSIDAMAISSTKSLAAVTSWLPRGKHIRWEHTFDFDRNCPTCRYTTKHYRSFVRH